jgi:hypothetical protein
MTTGTRVGEQLAPGGDRDGISERWVLAFLITFRVLCKQGHNNRQGS